MNLNQFVPLLATLMKISVFLTVLNKFHRAKDPAELPATAPDSIVQSAELTGIPTTISVL